MPQAIYTAAKGLYEEAGSGFSISDAPIILGTQAVELKQIVYRLTFTGVTTVDDEESGGGLDDGTTAYQNQTFDLYDADGNAITFGFTHTNNGGAGGTSGVDVLSHTGTAISISDGDDDAAIATAVASAISGYDSGNIFAIARTGAVVTVYVKKPGLLSAANLATVAAQVPLNNIAENATTAAFTATFLGGASEVSSNLSDTTNQIHGAGLSVVTLEQDNADAAIVVPFADGSSVGQEKFIQHGASTGPLILSGKFQKGAATGTELTLAAGSTEWLIWNGSQWYLALNVGTI